MYYIILVLTEFFKLCFNLKCKQKHIIYYSFLNFMLLVKTTTNKFNHPVDPKMSYEQYIIIINSDMRASIFVSKNNINKI